MPTTRQVFTETSPQAIQSSSENHPAKLPKFAAADKGSSYSYPLGSNDHDPLAWNDSLNIAWVTGNDPTISEQGAPAHGSIGNRHGGIGEEHTDFLSDAVVEIDDLNVTMVDSRAEKLCQLCLSTRSASPNFGNGRRRDEDRYAQVRENPAERANLRIASFNGDQGASIKRDRSCGGFYRPTN
jgi:hypothetical protein